MVRDKRSLDQKKNYLKHLKKLKKKTSLGIYKIWNYGSRDPIGRNNVKMKKSGGKKLD